MAEFEPYQQRVVEEMEALEDKILKLETFLKTPFFSTLSGRERDLLSHQYYIMRSYFSLLSQRIKLFNQK